MQRRRHGGAKRPAARACRRRDARARASKLELYYWMRLTRTLEERLVTLLPADQGRRRTLPLARPGGGRGRLAPSRSSARDMLSPLIRNLGSMLVKGATPVEILRQYMAKGDSPTRGRELEHPLRRPRSRLHRPDLAARRHGAGDGRRHALVQAARRGPRGPRVRRRRRDQHRRVPRGDQLRGGAALPARRDRREQRLRLLDADVASRRAAKQFVDKARGLRRPRRARRRQRRARGVRGRRKRAVDRARARRRRHAHRADDLPAARGTPSTTTSRTCRRARSSAGPRRTIRSTASSACC